MSKEEKNTEGQTGYRLPSKEVIAAWKDKYPEGVHKITVEHPVDKTKHSAFLRQPGIVDVQRARASEKKKSGTFEMSIYENCKLDADPMIGAIDSMMLGVMAEIGEVIEVAEATSEKL